MKSKIISLSPPVYPWRLTGIVSTFVAFHIAFSDFGAGGATQVVEGLGVWSSQGEAGSEGEKEEEVTQLYGRSRQCGRPVGALIEWEFHSNPLINGLIQHTFKINFFYWNIMVTCDQQEKVAYSPKVSLENFLQLTNKFWRYAELNSLWVGWSEIPILWELQQDNRTVCCGHTTVGWDMTKWKCWILFSWQ